MGTLDVMITLQGIILISTLISCLQKEKVVDEMEIKSEKSGINKCNDITNNGYIAIQFTFHDYIYSFIRIV